MSNGTGAAQATAAPCPLADNLGPVDIRLVTTTGDIDLLNQDLDGAWSYMPTVPLMVLRIEAHTQGALA